MKKLNKKGFTLIELLAVIVILAIVLVVTIPSVLNAMQSAKEKQFNNALTTIEQYVEQEYNKCVIADSEVTGGYDTNLLDANTCTLKTGYAQNLIAKTGYTDVIEWNGFTVDLLNGKATVSAADGIGSFDGLSR